MESNKGQALVEFIMILPVLIIILLSIVDFGNIISNKYSLENDLDAVVQLYQNGEMDQINTFLNTKKEEVEYKKDNKFIIIQLKKEINIMTPILNNIIGKKYNAVVERSIINE